MNPWLSQCVTMIDFPDSPTVASIVTGLLLLIAVQSKSWTLLALDRTHSAEVSDVWDSSSA